MYQEPNCDMDLEIYKDWIYEFNDNDDLREVDFAALVYGTNFLYYYHFALSVAEELSACGEGDCHVGDGGTYASRGEHMGQSLGSAIIHWEGIIMHAFNTVAPDEGLGNS